VIVAVASRKASPGATCLTAWLAQFWSEPDTTRLIIEADPAGGSLAARWSAPHRLTWDPGLLTLTTTRAVLTEASLAGLTQRLTPEVLVAAAPPGPDQVVGGLTRWGDRGPAELAALAGVRAFVDCGRLTSASPALALARRAALTILVCRPRLDEVSALIPAGAELSATGCSLGLVCVGDQPYGPAEIAQAAGIDLLGVLPVDPRAAAVFDRDGLNSGRAFRRSPLAVAAAEVADLVRSRCANLLLPSPSAVAPAPVSPAIAAARARAGAVLPSSDPTAPVWPPPSSSAWMATEAPAARPAAGSEEQEVGR
jgi:hypothetical protein